MILVELQKFAAGVVLQHWSAAGGASRYRLGLNCKGFHDGLPRGVSGVDAALSARASWAAPSTGLGRKPAPGPARSCRPWPGTDPRWRRGAPPLFRKVKIS